MRGVPVNVPEPNALALVCLGVFGIGMMRRRIKYPNPSRA
ncbi:PEP-CTERM sorting domain-containing protein [Sedimenticola hydrogenitrophicus]